MATLTIRNLDETVATILKAKAKANDRSLEAEARFILAAATKGKLTREEAIALSDLARSMTPKGVKQTDSVELLRESREERDRRFEEVECENREVVRQRARKRK